MTDTSINPFGSGGEVPAGYPIADDLSTNNAQKALSARQGMKLKEMMAQQSQMPTLLKCGEPTNIIYTIDDFYMAHEYDQSQGIDNLKFSTDLGKTWITVQNTYGDIMNAFMFSDGTFMMATRKAEGCRIYWTRDFSTFTEATIIDWDGSPYVMEAGKTRFYMSPPKSYHTYIDGVEHHCFIDYIISTTKPRVWYALSDENGVTVRAAFAFGHTLLNGSTLPARHIHHFEYNANDGYFYVLTGDSVTECHVMRGRYTINEGTHVWTWEKLATGGGYKLTACIFDAGNIYAVTDYTESALADYKGLVSIPIDKIGITTSVGGIVFPAKLRYWFRATSAFMAEGSYYSSGGAAIASHISDNNGWRICGTDYLGGTKIMIAKGDHNFVWVNNDVGKQLVGFFGPNNRGEIFAKANTPGSSVSGEQWLNLAYRTTYNITEAMRNSGATDFYAGWEGTPY